MMGKKLSHLNLQIFLLNLYPNKNEAGKHEPHPTKTQKNKLFTVHGRSIGREKKSVNETNGYSPKPPHKPLDAKW